MEAFHESRFFDIPRLAAYRRQIHAAVVTIGYRDRQRTHETMMDGPGHSRLESLSKRLQEAGSIERFFTPTRVLYEELLKTGWNVNATGERDGKPALECAARAGEPDAAKTLLDAGALISRYAWMHAAARRDADVLMMMDAASPLDWTKPIAREVLAAASRAGGPTLDYLFSRGAAANAIDGAGRPLLMTSISFGAESLRSTELLLSRGADPDARDRSGSTALHVAAGSLNTGFISQLVASGADVEARNAEGRTPLMIATDRCHY